MSILGADGIDSKMRMSNLTHRCNDDLTMHDLSVLAADVLEDGLMLSHDVVEWDSAHLEDIQREAAAKNEEGAWRNRWILRRRQQGLVFAAWPLDGFVLLCCKLTHACPHPQHHERELR